MRISDVESAITEHGEETTLKVLLSILKSKNRCKKCDGSGKVFIHSYILKCVMHECNECNGKGYTNQ